MNYVLIEVDQGPCGNGLQAIETEIALSNDAKKLVLYSKTVYGKEVGKPERFSWDNYFIVRESTIKIIM